MNDANSVVIVRRISIRCTVSVVFSWKHFRRARPTYIPWREALFTRLVMGNHITISNFLRGAYYQYQNLLAWSLNLHRRDGTVAPGGSQVQKHLCR